MDLNLQDKIAIVTGAARGTGKASALMLGREGAKVVIDDIDYEESKLDVTLFGVLNCCKAVPDTMLKQKSGSIVNVASDSMRGPQIDRITIYGAGKGGITAFSKNLAYEPGPSGIRVNCISPGTVKTSRLEAVEAAMKDNPDAEIADKFAKDRMASIARMPLRRMGTPQDIANLVAFLVSDVSSYVTGQNISINGGRFMA